MYEIQVIDVITFVILLVVIIGSIVLYVVLKKKLKDIEGDSEVYILHDEMDVWDIDEKKE